jgi:hypothetical protein
MSLLIGIAIRVKGVEKFVGKVATIPPDYSDRLIAGKVALYRELKYGDVLTRSDMSISVDVEAWNYAETLGARGQVIYCTDTKELLIVRKADIVASPKVNLGERSQYRTSLRHVTRRPYAPKINVGFTREVINLTDNARDAQQQDTDEIESEQLSLLD